jgi:hypothetical protein
MKGNLRQSTKRKRGDAFKAVVDSPDHRRSTSTSQSREGRGDAFKVVVDLPDRQRSTSAGQMS